MTTFTDISVDELNDLIERNYQAFLSFRKTTLKQRADFMRAIAAGLEGAGDELLEIAMAETALPMARLRGERTRTAFQLTSYAAACERGDWLEARIDTAIPGKNPPKPDIRKMLVPLGPVAVFGAANFPFAYSTAGGDTASAFAAGCTVIVKAHPMHAGTSETVANIIHAAAKQTGMPEHVFTHIHGASFEIGRALIEHPRLKAAGFTGSLKGGKQLFDWANQRPEPIPVFAEMSSINPVFFLPGKMKAEHTTLATSYAGSITLGVGQFCTNPGLLIAIDNADTQIFAIELAEEIKKAAPGTMLNMGIFKNYVERRANALAQEAVQLLGTPETDPLLEQGLPTLATVTADEFLQNPLLHQEVFGPFSLLVTCKDEAQMLEVATKLEGQLTTTLNATDKDLSANTELIDAIEGMCGRFILNGVPTGVEVCLSMQHGGPYPSTTDSRFGSVGADAIRRFARPLSFQNWSDQWLPDALKNINPLGIWRTVNDELKREGIN